MVSVQLILNSSAFKTMGSILIVLGLAFLVFQLVCSILTIVYIKRNVLEGNTAVKKAVTKVLVYLAVASILSIIYSVSTVIISFISGNRVIVSYIFRRLVFNIPAIATPIVAIILLKPIRVAMKAMGKKVSCCPNNQVAPAPATAEH